MIYFFDIDLKLKKIVSPKNALSAVHEQELNNHIISSMVMDMSYAKQFIDDVDHFGYYWRGNFYLHRIRRVEDSHINEAVTVTGRHIFFEDMLYGLPINDFRPHNRDAAFMLRNTIDANTRWNTVMTDVTGTLSTNFYRQVPWDVIEWVVENFRVEFEPVILFDGQNINGFQLHVANKLGVNKHKRIPFSRVTELDYEIDYSEIITSLAGYGKGEEVGEGYGRRINIADIDFSRDGVVSPLGSHYMENPNITAMYGKDNGEPKYAVEEFPDIEDPIALADAMYDAYLEMSRPKIAFSASVIDVGDVGIGDTQTIVRPERNVFYSVRIHKLIVDLHHPEDADVELGDYAHFKESKVERKSKQADKNWKKRHSDAIEQIKREWTLEYEGMVKQIEQGYQQAVIDANAETQAAEERMNTRLTNQRTEVESAIDTAKSQAITQAEQDAKQKADAVKGDLDTYKTQTDTRVSNISGDVDKAKQDILTNVADIKEKADNVRVNNLETDVNGIRSDVKKKANQTTVETIQGNLATVEDNLATTAGNLTQTKQELEQKLAEAKAELDGLEVGGRNLIIDGNDFKNRYTPRYETNLQFTEGVSVPEWQALDATRITSTGGNNVHKAGATVNDTPTNTIMVHSVYIKNEAENPIQLRVNTNMSGSSQFSFVEIAPGSAERMVVKVGRVNYNFIQLHLFTMAPEQNLNVIMWHEQLEIGTIVSNWTPALEDTEQKITDINQELTNIDGLLQAKLDKTEINPINDKITEHSNTLTATAEDVSALQSKTTVHDGNISTLSNETTANAEGLSQVVGRVAETESGLNTAITDIQTNAGSISTLLTKTSQHGDDIETAKTNIQTQAGSISTLLTKTSRIDGEVSQAKTDIQTQAGSISTLLTQTGEHESKITTLRADVDGVQTGVNDLSNWRSEKGTLYDQTADKVERTVWKSDIESATAGMEGRNLILGTDFKGPHNRWVENTVTFNYDDGILSATNNIGASYPRILYHIGEDIEKNSDAVLTFEAKADIPMEHNLWLADANGSNRSLRTSFTTTTEWQEYSVNIETDSNINPSTRLQWWVNSHQASDSNTLYLRKVRLNKGTKALPYSKAPEDTDAILTDHNTRITETAEGVKTLVQKTDKQGDDISKAQTDISTQAGRIDTTLTKVGNNETKITGLQASYDGVSSTVNDLSNWRNQKGTIYDQTADKVQQRVWSTDIKDAIDDIDIDDHNKLLNYDSDQYTTNGTVVSPHRIELNIGQYVSWEFTDTLPQNTDYVFTIHDSSPNVSISIYHSGYIEIVPLTSNKTVRFNTENHSRILIMVTSDTDNQYIGKTSLKKGTKETDWTPAPEDTIQFTDLTLKPGSFSLGTTEIGGKTFATGIVGDAEGLSLIGDNVDVSNNLTVQNTVKAWGIEAVTGDFANIVGNTADIQFIQNKHLATESVDADKLKVNTALVNKLVADTAFINEINTMSINAAKADFATATATWFGANVIESDWLKVDTALLNRFTSDVGFINSLTSKTAFIRDIQAIDISAERVTGGVLRSQNNNTYFSLNTGVLQMESATFNLGGGADIQFEDPFNTIYYSRTDTESGVPRTAGVGVGRSINNRFPFIFMGTTGTARSRFAPKDENWFTGFIANTNGRMLEDNIGNSVVGNIFHVRDESVAFKRGFIFDLTGYTKTFKPMNPQTYTYDIGSETNWFDSLYIRKVRINDGNLDIRNIYDTLQGWSLNVSYNNTNFISLVGLNAGPYWNNPRYYSLGKDSNRFSQIYLLNQPNVSSDERLKTDITYNKLGLDFIRDIDTIRFRMDFHMPENHLKYGVSAQNLLSVMKKHGVDMIDQSIVNTDSAGMYGVEYTQLIAPIMLSIQETALKDDEQDKRIGILEKENKELKKEVKILREAVA